MNNSALIQIARFMALVATQLLVLSKVQFSGYLNPYIYILFIFLLPLRTPPLTMIFTGFALGLIIDFYSGMMGIHTASTLFIAYFRNRIIKVVIGVREEDFLSVPGLKDLGAFRFIYYAGIMTLIHHTILFFLEAFSFAHAGETIGRVAVNTVVSLLFMVVTLILFEKKHYESSP
jgi:rod shape-determining protein MreD